MRRFYSHLPYYLVILFFYWPLYELFLLVVSDPLTLKELYINNLLFFTPLVILIYRYSIATVSVSHFDG